MTPRFTGNEIAKIQKLLDEHVHQKGFDILGAQLGQCIRRAISPKTVKSIGNLRSLVDNELREVLKFVEALPSDSLYRVTTSDEGDTLSNPDFVPVSGAKLWESFSNPNVDCLIGIDSAALVYVASPAKPFGPEITPISKMTSDEYHELAKAYTEEQTDTELKDALAAALDHPIFYPKWIATLRTLRTASANYLKSWEIKRTDLVVERLQQELEKAGVSPGQAAIIANEIRPQSIRSFAKPAEASTPRAAHQAQAPSVVSGTEPKEHKELRVFLHRAIDRMSLADLRDIRVPAGLLLEIYQEQAD